MEDSKIINTITRITDGDNITFEMACEHLAAITGRTADDIASLYVRG